VARPTDGLAAGDRSADAGRSDAASTRGGVDACFRRAAHPRQKARYSEDPRLAERVLLIHKRELVRERDIPSDDRSPLPTSPKKRGDRGDAVERFGGESTIPYDYRYLSIELLQALY
jgi:hypothetical protein